MKIEIDTQASDLKEKLGKLMQALHEENYAKASADKMACCGVLISDHTEEIDHSTIMVNSALRGGTVLVYTEAPVAGAEVAREQALVCANAVTNLMDHAYKVQESEWAQ